MIDLLRSAISSAIGPLIDLIPNKNERARAEEDITRRLLDATNQAVQGQLKINDTQAQLGSIFVAGARPAIMWICGAALGWNYILQPIFNWVAFISGVDVAAAPSLETGELTTILLGMLGLGTMRSFEKRHGVARSDIRRGNGP